MITGVFMTMQNQLVNSDCLTFMRAQSDGCVDLTVTSPPYNVDINYEASEDALSPEAYEAFSKEWLTELFRITKSTGRLCLNIPLDKNKGGMTPVYANFLAITKEVGWKYQSTIVWNEQNISRRTAWGSWKSASAPYVIAPVEMIVILYKDTWKKATKGVSTVERDEFIAWTNGVWTFNGEKKKRVGGHPAAFPEELPKRCIKLFSYVDDVVFDPFAGSGTTLAVAQKLERKWLGTEMSAEYHAFASKRLGLTE